MAVEGRMKCVKYLLFLSNFIFWLCGLALIIVGILVQIALHKTLIIQDASASAPLVVIAVGVVILFISFFGCCGACKESHCMVTMFAVLLSLIIIVEIGAAIAGYVFRGKVTEVVQKSLTEMITKYNNGSEEFKKVVDQLQEDWRCCGIHNSSDWVHFRPDSASVPDSCCVNVTSRCGVGSMTNATVVHQEGCQIVVEEKLKSNIQWVIVAALIIAFLQIMGIIFSCMLMRGIRSGYEVM